MKIHRLSSLGYTKSRKDKTRKQILVPFQALRLSKLKDKDLNSRPI